MLTFDAAKSSMDEKRGPSERRMLRDTGIAYSVLKLSPRGSLARPAQRRRASGAARELLIAMLAALTGTRERDWAVSPSGRFRPFLLRQPARVTTPCLSLSHDGNTVACCASWSGPVGIDFQRQRSLPRLEAIASFLGWPKDLPGHRDQETLTRAWTAWEACSKASGRSVLGPLPEFRDCLGALEGRPSRALCIDERLDDGWLVVTCLRSGPGESRTTRWYPESS